MKRSSCYLILLLVLSSLQLSAQQQNQVGAIQTSGECSPVVVGGSPTINCPNSGLTKEQAETLAKQYAQIINRIRRESLDVAQVLSKLNEMASDLHDVAQATRQRHLSASDKDQLKKLFNPAPRSEVIVIFAQTGEEPTTFAQDFVDVYNEVVEPTARIGVGIDAGPDRVRQGIQLRYNDVDVKEGTVPTQCTRLLTLMNEGFHLNVLSLPSRVPARGNCWLMIGPK